MHTETTPPEPVVDTFSALSLSDGMLASLEAVEYETPTPVQASCIPLISSGIDLILQSQTGTGKTAAFAIPVIETLGEGPHIGCLVLTPTRELAKQVAGEFARLSGHRDLPVAAIYGGAAFGPQLRDLKKARVVVATPGRLLDHLRNKALSLDQLEVFILDEADEMLSMGFEKELDAILEYLPKDAQSVLCSATVGEHVKRLASHFTKNPEYISLSSDSVGARNVEHHYFVVSGMQLLRDLNTLIEAYQPDSALIFCNTRADTQLVRKHLQRSGYPVDMINGDLPQRDRENALLAVKEGRIRFLVATDVAARGIDISELPFVINYNMPDNGESYVHRTGRTGRAGQHGLALTLMTPSQIGTYYQLIKIYKLDLIEKELPTREDLLELRENRLLDELLEALEGNRVASRYAPLLGLADRLLEMPDARQHVARLLAHFSFEQQKAERAEAKKNRASARKAKKAAQEEAEKEEASPRASRSERRKEDDAPRKVEQRTKSEPEPEPEPEPDVELAEREEAPREKARPEDTRDEEAHAGPAPADTSNADDDEKSGDAEQADDDKQERRDASDGGFVKLRLSVGKRNFESVEEITQFVCHHAGLFDEDLGDVDLRDTFCVIAVRQDFVQDAIDALDGMDLEGNELRVTRARRRRRRRGTARKSASSEV